MWNCPQLETNILAVLRFEKPFERDVFRFNPFSTFRETTFERVRIQVLKLRINHSRRGMTRLIYTSEKHVEDNFLAQRFEHDFQRYIPQCKQCGIPKQTDFFSLTR